MNEIEVYGRKLDWEEIIEEIESYIKTDKNLSVGEEHSLKFSLELLLKERQSDKERIKELEESEKYIYEAYQDAGKKMFEYAEELENSIPKSLIKEKIEELKLRLKDDCIALHEFQRLAKIDVLEELLYGKM